MGILICGLNGAGKSTLGKMLADTAIDVANGESVPSFRSVKPSLVVRESSGRLNGGLS